MNEPVADAVRGFLDGHVVLSRRLANANHYPAVDVLRSVSRLDRAVCTRDEMELISGDEGKEGRITRRRNRIELEPSPAVERRLRCRQIDLGCRTYTTAVY